MMSEINITSAQYVADPEDSTVNAYIDLVVDGDTMTVPLDTDNRHYQAILKWASQDGNTIQDAS